MSKIIVQGKAQGTVLKTTSPINFLGAVDKKTGVIRDEKYDIFKKSIKDIIGSARKGWFYTHSNVRITNASLFLDKFIIYVFEF